MCVRVSLYHLLLSMLLSRTVGKIMKKDDKCVVMKMIIKINLL